MKEVVWLSLKTIMILWDCGLQHNRVYNFSEFSSKNWRALLQSCSRFCTPNSITGNRHKVCQGGTFSFTFYHQCTEIMWWKNFMLFRFFIRSTWCGTDCRWTDLNGEASVRHQTTESACCGRWWWLCETSLSTAFSRDSGPARSRPRPIQAVPSCFTSSSATSWERRRLTS